MSSGRVRYDLKCKTRDSYGNFTGIDVVGWAYTPDCALDILIDAITSYNNHCYDHWFDVVWEKSDTTSRPGSM